MLRGDSEITIVARLPISAFNVRPPLRDEVFAQPFDKMIQRAEAVEKGSVAVGPSVQVVRYEPQPEPEIIVDVRQYHSVEA